MQISFSNKPTKNSLLIYPILEKGPIHNAFIRSLVQKLGRTIEFNRKAGEVFFTSAKTGSLPERIVLMCLPEEKKLTVADVMETFGAATKTAAAHHSERVSILLLPELFPFAESVIEAVSLANYQPALAYKTGNSAKKLTEKIIKEIEVVGVGKNESVQRDLKKGILLASIANETRDWVNAPPNYASTDFFNEKAKVISKEIGAKLTILRNKELTKLGMGALLAVNRGSPEDASLVILDYLPKGANPKEAPLVFVGKGVVFDSGGYNLKPHGHIEDMQCDKAGASTILGLMSVLSGLGIKRRVVGVIPFTENLIGKNALKPSEIIKSYAGKTIEITNTDAEGRLILADAIAYAIKEYKPKLLIDIATLTGACMVALGDRYAGLFGNDETLIGQLLEAGKETDELLWHMPIHKNHSKAMKGQYADLRNADIGSERHAGASKGAAFIKEFVKKTPWAHIDIAAPAFTTDPKKYESKGATGFGLRVLARFLEKLE